jgi:hypothetical protein
VVAIAALADIDLTAAAGRHHDQCSECAGGDACPIGLAIDDALYEVRAFRACVRWLVGSGPMPLTFAVELERRP